ncbi:phage associated protein [Caudoviricetes sp.]|nr:phage associated protein [Caudoviricetes sp.]
MSVKPITASVGGSGDFELVPAGVYLARCYKMVDMGTQKVVSKKFGTKEVRQVILYWELLQDDDGGKVAMEDGRPFSISKTYTLSMNKKANLRSDLDSWRGVPFTDAEAEGFDITKLLDKFCKLQVVHNKSGDKVYANVGSIMTTKKTAEGVNEVAGFSMADPDMEVFGKLPQWLQDKIRESAEWDDDVEVDSETDAPAQATADSGEIDIKDVPF